MEFKQDTEKEYRIMLWVFYNLKVITIPTKKWIGTGSNIVILALVDKKNFMTFLNICLELISLTCKGNVFQSLIA